VVGVELVVGYLIAWVVRQAHKFGRHLEGEVDQVLDAGLERLHGVVFDKLGADSALVDLHDETADSGAVSDLTRQRVDLAIQAAAAKDPAFCEAVERALSELAAADPARAGGLSASGDRVVAVGGDVGLRAEGGSAAALTMRDVTFGAALADPSSPGRSSD